MSSSIAIVTGGAGDLGRGICKALTSSGATVVALDLDPSGAEGAERSMRCDVTDPNACASAVARSWRTTAASTRWSIWLNSGLGAPSWSQPTRTCAVTFRVGPFATLRMMQLCYPHFKARGGGSIVNFGSASGTAGGVPGEGVYAGAKEAIRGFTKHAAVEWGRRQHQSQRGLPHRARAIRRDGPTAWSTSFPSGVLGDPEADVGSLVVYLAGPGSFITGRTIHVDGGAGTFR